MEIYIPETNDDYPIDRHCDRFLAMLRWMIEGHLIHGITPMRFPDLQPDDIERLYNVNFDTQFNTRYYTNRKQAMGRMNRNWKKPVDVRGN